MKESEYRLLQRIERLEDIVKALVEAVYFLDSETISDKLFERKLFVSEVLDDE